MQGRHALVLFNRVSVISYILTWKGFVYAACDSFTLS